MTQTILITGVTSGLGLGMARIYAGRGMRVVGVGRRPAAEADSGIFDPSNYVQADLSDPAAAEQIRSWLDLHHVAQIDRLIHNAALGWYGNFAEQTTASIAELVEVNLSAPLALTHHLLPLIPPSSGKIIFISSVAAVLPTADFAVYTATKAALDGLARSLRVELGDRPPVQVIHPGAVNTGLHGKIGIAMSEMRWDKFPSTDITAAQIVRAIDSRRGDVAIGFSNKLLYTAGRLVPGVLVRLSRPRENGSFRLKGPFHVLITGAADGIGRALAEELTRAGHDVMGVDIDAKRGAAAAAAMADLAGSFSFFELNLTDVTALDHFVSSLPRPLDVVIHNAGTSAVGRFGEMPLAPQRKVIDLNFTAPLQLTTLLAKKEKLSKGAAIYFLSSLSKFVGYPGAAAYAATKDGVASYAASLHAAAPAGLRTGVVYPGPTRTAHARRFSPDNSREERRMLPEAVAAAIAAGMSAGRRSIIPGPATKISAVLGYLFPGLMEKMMRRVIYNKLPKNNPES